VYVSGSSGRLLLTNAVVVCYQNGAKVVCGTEEGVLDIFNWGEWGNISDRFPGHPMSVDAIVPLSDSVVCTGASDGIIRYSVMSRVVVVMALSVSGSCLFVRTWRVVNGTQPRSVDLITN